MKLLAVLALSLLCSVASLAQSAPDVATEPSLIVTKYDHAVRIQEYTSYVRDNLAKATPPRKTDGVATPEDGIGLHSGDEGLRPVTRARIFFLYSAKVKNIGAKKIEAVVWDYIFVRTSDDHELGRFRFLNRSSIGPDKDKLLSTLTSKHPPLNELRVVDAKDVGKEDVPQYREKVEIKCIFYADGTWWRHGKSPACDCESLTKDKQRKDE